VLVCALACWLVFTRAQGHATSSGDPYSTPSVVDTNPDPHIVETTLTAEAATVDVGNGLMAHAWTYNGSVPGPTFHLKVGDTVIVHFHNDLPEPNAIHWHGIELSNEMDGTPFTQQAVPPGGSFLYKFKVTRPGIFWYHPHHHASTDQVFRGMYGMIVVTDPNEAALQQSGALPPASATKQIVLSDTTVCKAPGSNDTHTYDDNADSTPGTTAPWIGGGPLPQQLGLAPKGLCESPTAIDDNGSPTGSYAAGDIPAIQTNAGNPLLPTNEGQTVLTNGKNVGARAGDPAAPEALAPGASMLDVRPGQGLRLQIVNASTVRYMRLRLSPAGGGMIPLIRVGGEGGLLDSAIEEGGVISGFNTGYTQGETLIPPGSRVDIVAAIPASPTTGVLTLWTEDYFRTGKGYSDIPTVPVMHLNLTGTPVSPAYAISDGTPLRDATGDPVKILGPATNTLLNPAGFSPAKTGSNNSTITFNTAGGNLLAVDGIHGTHDVANYETAAHLGSSRYAEVGDILDLATTNGTGANHPFHLHGFSIQPLTLVSGTGTYTFPPEFRDTVDIPPGDTLHFKVQITDRPMPDGTTPGGAYGRWLFHCHIFFHAVLGMISELVVVPASGNERPDVNVDSAQVQTNQGHTASVTGTYFDPDGDPVTLSSSVGSVHDDGGGHYTWSFNTGRARSQIVYVTATDAGGLKAQIPFYLSIANHPPTLVLPGSKTGTFGRTLKFGIKATDPDAVDFLKFGASGLPAGLKLKDNHNRTATVSGRLEARPGKYAALISVSDGHNPTVSRTLRITVKPGELSPVIARQLRVSHGAVSVGCRVLHGSLRTCSVVILAGGKRGGSANGRLTSRGHHSLVLRIALNRSTLRKIASSTHGVTLTIKLSAQKFGAGRKLTATVIALAVSH
jgi:FtsP/CotA-like multicopper oxidase with cupredoxin domain